MLQRLRDNTKGVVAGILIGLLVIIFALSGAEALFSGGSGPREVVSVNGEKITESDIVRQINLQRRQILSRYGDSVPEEFVSDERLRPGAIDSLIQRSVLVQEAKSKGMAVSDQTLDSIIVSDEQFQGPEGQFDPNRYQQLLRSAGFTPASYKKMLREELLLNQLQAGIANSSFVTSTELEQVIALSYQTRDFQYVTLDADQVADQVAVTDEEVEEYYNNNQQEFTQDEQVAVDYIDLSVPALMEEIEIPEEEVRAQFEQNQAAADSESEANVQRRVAHILLEDTSSDADVVAEIEQQLAAGEDFAELAREYSDDLGSSEQGGDLGYITPGTFPESFEGALPELSVGEVSGPVETEAGTHLIKLLDERREEPETFEDQREEIAQQLKRVQAENRFVNLMERLSEVSYNAEDLAEVEEELGLPVQNTGLFSRSGGQGVAGNQKVIEAAFSEEVLERDNASDLLELSPNRVVVIKKTDHQEAYVRPLSEVRDRIVQTLEAQETRELLAERGEQIESALAAGENLESVAEQWDLEVQTATDTGRNDTEVNRELVRHVFSLPKPTQGEPAISGVHVNGNYTIVALSDVEPGSPESVDEQQRQALADNLSQMLGQRDQSAYRDLLRQEADIDR